MCRQLQMKLHPVSGECPIFDYRGGKWDKEMDSLAEGKFNDFLERSKKAKYPGIADNSEVSLGFAMDYLASQESLTVGLL